MENNGRTLTRSRETERTESFLMISWGVGGAADGDILIASWGVVNKAEEAWETLNWSD